MRRIWPYVAGVVFTAIAGAIATCLVKLFWEQISTWLLNYFQSNRRRPPARTLLPVRTGDPENGERSDQPTVQNTSGGNAGDIMIFARDLQIEHSDNPKFPEVEEIVELVQDYWLEINARINLNQLSPGTNYAAYLIFKTTARSEGLSTEQNASVSLDRFRKLVCLKPSVEKPPNEGTRLPVERPDGWMELELGRLCCNESTDQEAVVCLMETDDYNKKTGLIVLGVQVRPI
ncbi:hypothetical protein LUZ61_008396 [Rhynchospora tenuis]|uniref:Uncharacterized protein n=1 Tax=Rhynchospora tenuis TaxID=198213 RepID=A0AAD5ZVB2_9POAL|nr:hypothetical protein LUZ61_008396 [Rhynchospora tenuis]